MAYLNTLSYVTVNFTCNFVHNRKSQPVCYTYANNKVPETGTGYFLVRMTLALQTPVGDVSLILPPWIRPCVCQHITSRVLLTAFVRAKHTLHSSPFELYSTAYLCRV